MSVSDDGETRKHDVVIIGAGFGGNGVLKGLLKDDDNGGTNNHKLVRDDIHVTLIDKNTTFSIGACWQYIWSSRIEETDTDTASAAAEWNMNDMIANRTDNVTFITGDDTTTTVVERIDTMHQQVVLNDSSGIPYDTLVIAPGVISDPTSIKGLTDASNNGTALDICNIQHVSKMKCRINELMEAAKNSGTPKTILMCVTAMPYKVRTTCFA